ncbi:MAG TPA: hypothetical protein VKR32_03370 [Puia sp.]|nr:hypothetical protein [Puia sp.]
MRNFKVKDLMVNIVPGNSRALNYETKCGACTQGGANTCGRMTCGECTNNTARGTKKHTQERRRSAKSEALSKLRQDLLILQDQA